MPPSDPTSPTAPAARRPVSEASAAEAREDLALVQRCQKGDAHAFNELVTRYRQRVFGMAFHIVHNEQDAWDLAQDGFVKAWKNIDRFRGDSSFYTWLYRIVTNVAIDALRKKQIQGGQEFDETIQLSDIEPTNSLVPKDELAPSQKLERGELREKIDGAIQKLSPDHRAVILLKEMEGLQYHEIAETVGCSIGTVMSRLFYARRKLQTLLKDVYENF